jgi:hypothetical protein
MGPRCPNQRRHAIRWRGPGDGITTNVCAACLNDQLNKIEARGLDAMMRSSIATIDDVPLRDWLATNRA